MKNLGVMIIDMQHPFLWNGVHDCTESLIIAQVKLINFAASRNLPIFVLEYKGHGKTVDELARELMKVRSYYIQKSHDDGFLLNEELPNLLKSQEIRRLIITGVNKDACVKDTTHGAIGEGYEVFTSEDLMNGQYYRDPWYFQHSNHYQRLDKLLEVLDTPGSPNL